MTIQYRDAYYQLKILLSLGLPLSSSSSSSSSSSIITVVNIVVVVVVVVRGACWIRATESMGEKRNRLAS